jgi:glutamate-1-semialdehyde aminotransferase/predicted aldo/keto reductase-like oxidoreductase
MRRNRLGQTDIFLSAVGFGSAQFRMVSEAQVHATLLRGFELGVNWVHTAPDYGGAEKLVAEAIRKSGRDDVILASGCYGDRANVEALFETTCRIRGKSRLEMYGICCIDDREFVGENVWDPGGMVEFLVEKKKEGRIGAAFCTTHGPPEYVAKLIECGVFDGIMLAYNPVGFHVLSYHAQSEGKDFENIEENRRVIFPLAARHQVGLLIMKPFGGGIICSSKAFPPRRRFSSEIEELAPTDVLRASLTLPGVTSVCPGTASVAEAEENARAGHEPIALSARGHRMLEPIVSQIRTEMCSRCGECEPSCSKDLPISWMIREAYMWSYPGDSFDTIDRHHYFNRHPSATLACVTCTERTCECPYGIDIPATLRDVHDVVIDFQREGLMHANEAARENLAFHGAVHGTVVCAEIPGSLEIGEGTTARLWLENKGLRRWSPSECDDRHDRVLLRIDAPGLGRQDIRLRHMVEPGERAHFVFDIPPLGRVGSIEILVDMFSIHDGSADVHATRVMSKIMVVAHRSGSGPEGVVEPTPESYRVRYTRHTFPQRVAPGALCNFRLTLQNTGSVTWLSRPPKGNSFDVGMLCDGRVVATLFFPVSEVKPGDEVTIHHLFEAPMEPGTHTVKFGLVEQHTRTFEELGNAPLDLDFVVDSDLADRAASLSRVAKQINPWRYYPTQNTGHLADGTSLPVFAQRSEGCHVYDVDDREYLDYTMGWGTTVLGYSHPHVTSALQEAILASSPLLAYGQPIEIEVSQMLIEDFPSGEMVTYGKNGSDVCTLAARMSRVHTGRKTILYCGYHGWGDFWAEQAGFENSGIPDRDELLIHRFPFNDVDGFLELFDRFRDDLACVMLEPSGPWAGNEIGLEPDVDVGFLQMLRAKTHECGALLVFDEIVTGYRYLESSVQKARGVTPDLTCLGKSLASGMPLAALLGAEEIFRASFHRAHYGPTFQAEAYSFAAAKATIEVCRREPVAQFIWDYGLRLREGIEGVFQRVEFPAFLQGPPFRMSIFIDEPDSTRKLQMRTLLQQELLRSGISIYNNGVMLPSFAHDDSTLAYTLEMFARAADIVVRLLRTGDIAQHLEIPLLADM